MLHCLTHSHKELFILHNHSHLVPAKLTHNDPLGHVCADLRGLHSEVVREALPVTEVGGCSCVRHLYMNQKGDGGDGKGEGMGRERK